MPIHGEVSEVASVQMAVGEKWTVRRCRYSAGGENGRRVCLVTGVHGDEMMGQLALYDIAKRIKAAPQCLCGTVDLYPMVNPLGLDTGTRMVPSATYLDMNRAFPGAEDGTAMEHICHRLFKDMKGADLVLDIHASSQITSGLFSVRLHECGKNTDALISEAKALCPQVIWVLPGKARYNAMLTGALTEAGTTALLLEIDERRLRTQMMVDMMVDGIFCKLREMGVWTGEAREISTEKIPSMRIEKDACRVTCTKPGMFIPQEKIGQVVKEGDVLGVIFDALLGEELETVLAPQSGLIFSQRRYSAVYPGTLIARICREERA
ncbi:MAG: succinylglutamate desuccinylase/aspartoacylase family protein [Eubacteriales bacterium]|nr:succinylglutamate desuccinylase/aspartoacylase family protein [Eubacteriales bacterium]